MYVDETEDGAVPNGEVDETEDGAVPLGKVAGSLERAGLVD
jgi:hypothetical protein